MEPTAAGPGAFEGAGFADAAAAAGIAADLWRRLTPDSPYLRRWQETLARLASSADPDQAFRTWARFIEADEAPDDPQSRRAATWDASARFREGFIVIAALSPALGEQLLSLWPSFLPDSWVSGWETHFSLARRLAKPVSRAGDREFLGVVRRFQQVEAIRIAYLDSVQALPVDQVARQISTLADVCISACLQRARSQIAARWRLFPPRRGLVVLALGKLGGMELNYSSDVDLNFVYDEKLASLPGPGGKALDDPFEVERFFTQVSERVVQLLTEFTDDGQLYRVDTRLRPGGASGRLVWSARAAADYYYTTGRAWERQALIRLRPAAGDLDLATRLARDLDAFVFPASLSAAEVEEIRGLKRQMEKLAEERGPSEEQIKLGRGGIRDVEYIVQYLQLVHASAIPALKKANVFEALELLESHGFLKPEETDVLRRGYRFLRRTEHRIQMAHLRQTHRIPEDPREAARLARGLGFKSVEAFRGALQTHAVGIRRVYGLLFEEATARRPEAEELRALFEIPVELAARTAARSLAPFGFQDPAAAFSRLRALEHGEGAGITIDAQKSKAIFDRLLPRLLRELSTQPEPDRALSNFEECVKTLGARSVFYQLLVESDRVLQLFVELCARSNLVVERLRAHPDLFDEIVDALLTGYSFDRESLIAEVDRLLRESPAFEREVFKLKHLHLVLLAIRDLERLDNLSTTLLRIADLAEALLHAVFRLGFKEAEEKLGVWMGTPPRYLVLGLGKLGGQEMSYKSDVDIVILHEGEGTTSRGTGTQEYFERLSQMALSQSGLADAFGPLLKVDVRLRPLGSHNSLAISVDAWKQYFLRGQACTWERQAFLRARPVAGDEQLAKEALRFIREDIVLGGAAGPPSREVALNDILDMRRRIETNSKPGDLKRGEGGIVDVEFLVQALQLVHGKEHPRVLSPNTATGIRNLMDAGLLTSAQGSELLTSYQFLRWIENRISLVGESGQSLATTSPADLESLVQKIGYKSSGDEAASTIFRGELDYHRRVNRRELLRVLEAPEPTPGPRASP